jgi:hypothetical protein
LQGAIRTMGIGLLNVDAVVHASIVSDAHPIARYAAVCPSSTRPADGAATADTTSKRLAR